ncbi:MAG: DNA repair protein RadA [Clostridiales bacterium]|nr:DNA repair protein RadA [Clostridiales bacterium]
MAKARTAFACGECGYETARWMGKCPECGAWNSFAEQPAAGQPADKKPTRRAGDGARPLAIDEIPDEGLLRRSVGIAELDRVLGGGVVEGSMTLVGGDPGIGKSTLLTQASSGYAAAGHRVLYVSGEESARQIKMRARRLGALAPQLYVLAENDVDAVLRHMDALSPELMVIDSIQTMYRAELSSAPGTVSQVRESAAVLMRAAKASGCAMFLVGHVTKEGAIAGPRVLEHIVDAVLYFEGDRQQQYRLLRAVKNRFGSVNELGIFEMTGEGMREVPNASEALLSARARDQSGSVVMCALEGSRPILTDVQALVATTPFGNPRRMASGVDLGRLSLLLAVLEKRAGLPLYNRDVYVNIAGGMTLDEPAADLSLCVAIASSHRDRPLGRWAAIGEVGLAGEVRPVAQAERRLNECARMGFDEVVLPCGNLKNLTIPEGVRVHGVETLAEALAVMDLMKR